MSDQPFTHLDPLGRARMVDVTPKEPTHRRAVARCKVFMLPSTTAAIANREVKKGDVLAVARGVLAVQFLFRRKGVGAPRVELGLLARLRPSETPSALSAAARVGLDGAPRVFAFVGARAPRRGGVGP